MKRFLCFFLAVLMAVSMVSCVQKKPKIEKPVKFYYRKDTMEYGKTDGLIGSEIRESADMDDKELINLYLNGPEDTTLYQPFPVNTTLSKLHLEYNTAFLTLSVNFSELKGLELTIACACLTMTVCEITGAKQINVRCTTDALLDGYSNITMSPNDFLLLDDSTIVIDPD